MSIVDFYKSTLSYLHVRVHTTLVMEEIQKIFENYQVYIISFEMGNRAHYHILLGDNRKEMFGHNDNNVVRHLIKSRCKVTGNGGYSITKVLNETRMKAYILKDGDYVSKGVSPEDLEILKKVSYKKFDKKEFSQELEQIRISFMESGNIGKAIREFLQLKIDYNQTTGFKRVQDIIESWIMKRDGVERYAVNIERNISFNFS